MKTMEKINEVEIDLSHYSGEDYYSDGDIEETILKSVKTNTSDDLLKNSSDYAVFYHLSEIRHNLVEWIPFTGREHVLEIGSGCGAITGVFAKKAKDVVCVELSKRRSLINAYRNSFFSNIKIMVGNFQEIEKDLGEFDVISLIGVLEYSPLYITSEGNPFVDFLKILEKHLKKDGRILVAIENKMGMKYLNGAWEDHTMKQYEGINDYLSTDSVRTFSKQELQCIFQKAGYDKCAFYYPSPDYKLPDTIYSEERMPAPSEVRTFGKNYQSAQFYNFYDMIANDQVCNDGMFDYFSNSFLAILGKDTDVKFSKYSRERRAEYRIGTIIRGNGKKEVLKYALAPEAKMHIRSIKHNEDLLKKELQRIESKLQCLTGMLNEEGYITDCVKGTPLQQDFYGVRCNPDEFIKLAKSYINTYVLCPTEYLKPFKMTEEYKNVFGDNWFETMSMDVTNIDMIFSNLMRDACGDVVVIDYEWIFEFPIPYEYPAWRAVSVLYYQYSAYLIKKIEFRDYIKGFGFCDDKIECFIKMDDRFSEYVCGKYNCEMISKKFEKESIMQTNKRY